MRWLLIALAILAAATLLLRDTPLGRAWLYFLSGIWDVISAIGYVLLVLWPLTLLLVLIVGGIVWLVRRRRSPQRT